MVENLPLLSNLTIISVCIIFLLFLVFLTYNLRTFFLGEAPFVPTHNEAIPYIVDLLNLNADSVLFDISCGDGRILAAAIGRSDRATGIGVDINPFACLIARVRNKRLLVKIYQGDIFNYSLSKATHVYCYLLPHLLERLEAKIKNECHEGTIIINCDFHFPTLIPEQEFELSKSIFGNGKIFVYKIKHL